MSWQRARATVPPIGQGLAVFVLLAALALLILSGIGAYLFSLHVAAAGQRGRALDAQILAKQQQVHALRDELDIRSRFVELERWRPSLDLQATGEGQYAAGLHQLGDVATQRQATLQKIALARTSCATGAAPESQCRAGPASGQAGYAPQARQQMDSLIGDLVH